jgi:hypothetical protein
MYQRRVGKMVKEAKPGRGADQFPLRLPNGMRERIKTAAERHDVSMNEEIVNILLRFFPPVATLEDEINQVRTRVDLLRRGASIPGLAGLADAVEDLARDIARGRVVVSDPEARSEIADALDQHDHETYKDGVPYPAGEDE